MISSLPSHAVSLHRALEARSASLAIVGLGYVGLPLVEVALSVGFRVIGHDIDSSRIASLRQGRCPIGAVTSQTVAAWLTGQRLTLSINPACLADADAILICVPTPLTTAREPDLSAIRTAATSLASHLRPGQLVILTSTTYPGTTREVVAPLLKQRGLKMGEEVFLGYSPEREDPGNTRYQTGNIPRLVSGVDPVSCFLAQTLIAALTTAIPTSTPEVAEAAKLLENTYRAVNIALVNELKLVCTKADIDIWEVIEAAATKPFGFQPFYPGPGWGGHCIPIDPFYLAWLGRKLDQPARFIELAGEINTAMTAHVAARVADVLNDQQKPVKGSRVLLLGMVYKRDIDDVRESPGLILLDLLREKGADVAFNDPHVHQLRQGAGLPLASEPLTTQLLAEQDCVVIVTDHSAYDWDWIVAHSTLIVDTRNATRKVSLFRERIHKA